VSTAVGLVAALVAAAVFGAAAVLQARAVRRFGAAPTSLARFVVMALRDPAMLLVLVAYLTGFALHAVSIWLLPLYLAQAAIALSLPVTALASRRVDEHLGGRQWAAVALVTLGLVLLAAGSGRAGEVVSDAAFAAALVTGVLALLLASLGRRRWGGATLGTLAGLGYAGSAIAVRGVGTPLEPAVVVAALTIPAYGWLAFWVYSLGLRSAAVSSATAPMIVLQTFVPALVGVLALDDAVRPGWAPAIVAGLVLSTAGAVALSVSGVRSPGEPATGSAPGPAPRPGPRPRRSP
jgi:drug/metabolite transporter (DMT)-like permease